MFYIKNRDFIRTLRPFSDLSNPIDTIYDHLPYEKDITIIKESDVRLVSGNVLKYTILEDSFIIDTNDLSNKIIEDNKIEYELTKEKQQQDSTDPSYHNINEEDIEVEDDNLDMESIKALSEADENEDDYSFLND